MEEEGIRKLASKYVTRTGNEKYKIEWLGYGQQFAAYGIHPDTKKPYEWVDMMGGIAYINASELPIVSVEDMQECVSMFYEIAAQHGYELYKKTDEVKPAKNEQADFFDQAPLGLSLEEAKEHCNFLSSECSMQEWLNVGMALHHEYSGSLDAMIYWDEWSQGASNYVGFSDIETRWKSFGKRTDASTTMRSVIQKANEKKRTQVVDKKTQTFEEIKLLIKDCSNQFELMADVAKRVTKLVDNDKHLQAQALIVFKNKYKELSGASISDSEAKKYIRVAARMSREFSETEFANVDRFIERFGDSIMFVPELDQWFAFEGAKWAACDLHNVYGLLKQAIVEMVNELDTVADPASFFEFCKRSRSKSMMDNVISLLKKDMNVVVPASQLNKNPMLMGAPNGVIDLKTGELRAPNRNTLITNLTGVEYHPDADCPCFKKTLGEVFSGNQGLVDFFQKLIGYTLLANPSREKILAILYGSGSNGKSTILTPIQQVLGDYAKKADVDTFMRSSGVSSGNPREDLTRLAGSRFVYASEPESESVLSESLIKDMTGGEILNARAMYARKSMEFAPSWTVFLATNHLPIIKGNDWGIWRRLVPIPFTRNFDKDQGLEKDLSRPFKIAQELEGLLAWCVQGAIKYQQEGLGQPKEVRMAREEYMANMDLLSEWVHDRTEDSLEAFTSTIDLYNSFKAHAAGTNVDKKVPDLKSFIRKFINRSYKRDRVKGIDGFKGIALKPEEEEF